MRSWLADLMLVQLGVLPLWLANGSGSRILVAVLAHAASNVAVGFAAGGLIFDLLTLLTLTAATAAVITATRGRVRVVADDVDKRPSAAASPAVV